MCLGPEFFDQREAMIQARAAAGDLELERFMRSRRLRFGLLQELGYLKDSPGHPTTADVFALRVSNAARGFFREERDLQLIFVRSARVATLAARLRHRRLATAPEGQ